MVSFYTEMEERLVVFSGMELNKMTAEIYNQHAVIIVGNAVTARKQPTLEVTISYFTK